MARNTSPAAKIRWLALIAALSAYSCSFAFMDKVPPGWQASQPPDCSSSIIPPVIDLAPPAAAIVAVSTGMVTDDVDIGGKQLREAIAIVVILASTPWLASSIFGFHHRSKCIDAERDHERWRLTPAPAPGADAPK